jgi:hypothetical protein
MKLLDPEVCVTAHESLNSNSFLHVYSYLEPRQLISRYSDGLRAGRPGFDTRQLQGNFLYSIRYRRALRPTQPPVQWLPEFLYQG